MKTSSILVYVCYIIYLTGCGSGGGGADAKASSPSSPAPGIVQPTPGGGGSTPQTASATYYTLVKNANVTQGGHTYPITMTGHCVNYGSQDFCWDDGWQSIPAISYETDFWGLCSLGGVVGQCSGGGSTDPATTPKLWSSMLTHLVTPIFTATDVYTQGIATPVTCTITGTIVDCVDFQIDTTNASL